MRPAAWFLLFAFWAPAAFSQSIEIRAGEHDTFTRLVFHLPERQPYELADVEGAVELEISGPGYEFSTASVFERVPKTRLTAIRSSPDGGRLRLVLACACETRSFWYGDASLVIDILDAAAGENTTRPNPQTHPVRKTEPEETSPAKPDNLTTADVRYEPMSRTAAGLVASAMQLESHLHAPDAMTPETVPNELARQTRAAKPVLLLALGRAIDHGLVLPVSMADQAPEPTAKIASSSGEQFSNEVLDSGTNQIRAKTSVDDAMQAEIAARLAAVGQNACPPEHELDAVAWASDAPFSAQIGRLRQRTTGALDKPEPEAVRALARLYLHFGFGAEARQTLTELGPGLPDLPLLMSLARIVEMGHAQPGSPLEGWMYCGPRAALWSVLSHERIPENAALDVDAILQSFADLPVHLRAHLGPNLAENLLFAGYQKESAHVHRILSRSEQTVTPSSSLLGADLLLAQGAEAEAEAALSNVVAENAQPSGDALIKLIALRIEHGKEISYETAQLAGAYARERRGKPDEASYLHAHQMALAASGAFDEAFREWMSQPRGTGERNLSTLSGMARFLAESASDFDFLKYALSDPLREAEALSDDVATAIARRLVSLGFEEPASEFLKAGKQQIQTDDAQLARAEIALRRIDPEAVIAALDEVSRPEETMLLARAYSLAGSHGRAALLFAEAGQTAEADREAWLDATKKKLALEDTAPDPNAVREPLEGEPAILESEIGVLQSNLALAEDSAELRSILAEFLEAHPLGNIDR